MTEVGYPHGAGGRPNACRRESETMLENLSIRNFAIIETLDLEFQKGLNILSGETGAGKSIILQALSLIMGARAYSDLVRTGFEECEVKALFDISEIPDLQDLLKNQDYEGEDNLLVRRVISRSGKGKVWVNNKPATVNLLQECGKYLIDLVSQHESHQMFSEEMPRVYLDRFAENEDLLKVYQTQYEEYHQNKLELNRLQQQMKDAREREDLYRFQLREIQEADLKQNEEETLLQERKILANASKITEALSNVEALLYSGNDSAIELLGKAQNILSRFSDIDPLLGEQSGKISQLNENLEEVSRFLQNYLNKIDFDPERLTKMEERLNLIADLKRKHGGSLEALLEKQEELSQKVGLIENQEDVLEDLNQKVSASLKLLLEKAEILRRSRMEAAKKLSKVLEQELHPLAMPNAKIEIRVDKLFSESNAKEVAFSSYGMDDIQFYISPNKGEEPKAMTLIASGGELSRILLALKSVTRDPSSSAVFVFDEVDTGIGGAVAEGVGKKLKKLSESSQVICITHLPQIAACGDVHYQISKVEKKDRTITQVRLLEEGEREEEIARMLAGVKITDKALSHARELLKLMS